jgi:hypothetical protein
MVPRRCDHAGVSPEIIFGIVGAVVVGAGVAWAIYTWVSDRRQKVLADRTRLQLRLMSHSTTEWERRPNRPGDVGTTWLMSGEHLRVEVINPTDREVRLRRTTIIGATTGEEVDPRIYMPDAIERRDGFSTDLNPGWLRNQLPRDSAVSLKVETWDGETFMSEPENLSETT